MRRPVVGARPRLWVQARVRRVPCRATDHALTWPDLQTGFPMEFFLAIAGRPCAQGAPALGSSAQAFPVASRNGVRSLRSRHARYWAESPLTTRWCDQIPTTGGKIGSILIQTQLSHFAIRTTSPLTAFANDQNRLRNFSPDRVSRWASWGFVTAPTDGAMLTR